MAAVSEPTFSCNCPLSQLLLRHRGLIQTPRPLAMNEALGLISNGDKEITGMEREVTRGTWVRAQETCIWLQKRDGVDPKCQASSSALSLSGGKYEGRGGTLSLMDLLVPKEAYDPCQVHKSRYRL